MHCYLCDCRIKKNYNQCECCTHQFCNSCYSRIERFFIDMPDIHRDPIFDRHGYVSKLCPCSCEDSYICLMPCQMDDYLSGF